MTETRICAVAEQEWAGALQGVDFLTHPFGGQKPYRNFKAVLHNREKPKTRKRDVHVTCSVITAEKT